MISKPKLDCNYPAGNGVSTPVYKEGSTVIIPGNSSSISYSDGPGMTDTGPNKSAKYKYPRVSQDISELDRQYLNNK